MVHEVCLVVSNRGRGRLQGELAGILLSEVPFERLLSRQTDGT